jgi:hypothetical protein
MEKTVEQYKQELITRIQSLINNDKSAVVTANTILLLLTTNDI